MIYLKKIPVCRLYKIEGMDRRMIISRKDFERSYRGLTEVLSRNFAGRTKENDEKLTKVSDLSAEIRNEQLQNSSKERHH